MPLQLLCCWHLCLAVMGINIENMGTNMPIYCPAKRDKAVKASLCFDAGVESMEASAAASSRCKAVAGVAVDPCCKAAS